MNILTTSSIRSVTQYTASPVATCDRCSAGIKYVFVVTYKDGETQRFGSECINKILAGRTDLISLFKKNAKKLKKYQDYVAILTGPVEDMPRGSEYFGSGLFFVADSEGKDIFLKHWFFHPVMDAEKNAGGGRYVNDPVKYAEKSKADIARDLPFLTAEITRLELFLAKVLRALRLPLRRCSNGLRLHLPRDAVRACRVRVGQREVLPPPVLRDGVRRRRRGSHARRRLLRESRADRVPAVTPS